MDAAGVQEGLPPPQGGKAPRRDSEYLRCRFEAIEVPQTFSGPGGRSAEAQDLTQAEWRTCAERRRFPRMTSELVLAVMGRICPMALVLLGLRINQQSFGDNAFLAVSMILTCVGHVATGVWGDRSLGNAPPGAKAAQAPAGGIAEGARCSVEILVSRDRLTHRAANDHARAIAAATASVWIAISRSNPVEGCW